jgi:ParB/RepB/Spo0J family partition protein
VADPSSRSRIRGSAATFDSARSHLDKRRAELRNGARERLLGPQGEQRSEAIAKRVELVPLNRVKDDPNFQNVRLRVNEEEMEQLVMSMNREGLKVPVELVETTDSPPWYHVRAGFRRTEAAQKLRWRRIPAIILPANTPIVDEYWTNIIENSARSKLSTYEIAKAAQLMRDRFQISFKEFAQRAGYSEPYVGNLLRCVDKLPVPIQDEWARGAPIPVDKYISWSQLEAPEAVREMLTFTGRNPKVTRGWSPSAKVREIREKAHPIKMASPTGLSRMQRLRIAIEVCRQLEDKDRQLGLWIVDYCAGARDDVPGVLDKKIDPVKQEEKRSSPPPEDLAEAAAEATLLSKK